MLDIWFYEAFEEEAETLRRRLGPQYRCAFSKGTIQEDGHTEPPARLISIRTQSVVPPAWAGRAGAVLSRSTGYDHLITFRAHAAQSIPCGFLEEYATNAVAEQALLLTLSLLRRLPRQVRQMPQFNRDGLTGRECAGCRLLVVGVGRIGGRIVELGRAVGMEVKGVDLAPKRADLEYLAPAAGMAWADVIVAAMNLTGENRGYFDYERLRQAKPGCLFVNIARGELSPPDGLIRLLEDGVLGGVGLDVYDHEDELGMALRGGDRTGPAARAVEKLQSFPNVVLTPHNAFNTREALERKSQMSVDQIDAFFATGKFLWQLE